jgi:Spt5 transcription elongation factor, acidic N-terminal
MTVQESARRRPTTGSTLRKSPWFFVITLNSLFRYRDFIIEEAEVDSDVDEDDEYEGDFGEIGIVGNEVEESGQTAREIENRRRMGMLWE